MSSTPPGRAVLDVRALVDPVDRATVLAYRRDLKQRTRGAPVHEKVSVPFLVFTWVLRIALIAVLLAVGAVVLGAAVALLAVGLLALGLKTPVVVTLLTIVFVGAGLLLARGIRRSAARGHEQSYRLARFAAANGFDLEPRVAEPERASRAFDVGINRVARDVVRTRGPRPVEVATYVYSAGYRNGEPFAWTYATVPLDRTLPHVVVETLPARGVRGARAPQGIERVWELPVDGPFGDRHRAYGPVRSSAGTARGVFTPEVVETLVRGPHPLAAEVTGDRLFLFSERPLDLLDPAVWERLLGAADDLAGRLARS